MDEDGFDDFLVTALGELHRFGYLLSHSATTADDLTQFALVKTLGAWPRLRDSDVDRQMAYARRIMANAHISWWRGWSARVTPGAVPERHDVDDPVAAWAERDALVRALGLLPKRQRTVLVLRYYAGRSEAEIAATLKWRPGTVKSTASRALTGLRSILTTEAADRDQEART